LCRVLRALRLTRNDDAAILTRWFALGRSQVVAVDAPLAYVGRDPAAITANARAQTRCCPANPPRQGSKWNSTASMPARSPSWWSARPTA